MGYKGIATSFVLVTFLEFCVRIVACSAEVSDAIQDR